MFRFLPRAVLIFFCSILSTSALAQIDVLLEQLPNGADGLAFLNQEATSVFLVKSVTDIESAQPGELKFSVTPERILKGPVAGSFDVAVTVEAKAEIKPSIEIGDLVFFKRKRDLDPQAGEPNQKLTGETVFGRFGIHRGASRETIVGIEDYLRNCRPEEARAWAIRHLSDPDSFLFRSAVLIVQSTEANLLPPPVVQSLIDHLKAATDSLEASLILEILGRVATPEAMRCLQDIALDPNKLVRVREAAFQTLLYLPDGVANLEKWQNAKDTDETTRDLIKKTLGNSPELIPIWSGEVEAKVKQQLASDTEKEKLDALSELKRHTITSPPVAILRDVALDVRQPMALRTEALNSIALWKKSQSAFAYFALAQKTDLALNLRREAIARLSENADVRLKIQLLGKLGAELEVEELRELAKRYVK